MFRFLIQIVVLLFVFAIGRSLLHWILRTASGSLNATAQPDRDQLIRSAGELHKDPVCGTFVPVSSQFTRNVQGRTVYFCSAKCRERFPVSARA